MININNVVLVGRLTKDIELRKTQTNKSVCNFTLAINRNQQEADFINIIAWNQSADFLSQYAKKGAIVSVEGRIQTRNYDGTNGKVYITEVIADHVQIISQKPKETNEFKHDDFNYQQSLGGTLSNRDDKFYEEKYGKTNIKTDEIPPEELPFY